MLLTILGVGIDFNALCTIDMNHEMDHDDTNKISMMIDHNNYNQ